jgi:acetylornithine deacetylase/succinyl-diaminopimelate desuccinylase-like protein
VSEFLKSLAPRESPPRSDWYRDVGRALREPAARQTLLADREIAPQLMNTLSITVVRIGYKTNVIPGTAEAELDVRLLPGEDPDAFVSELRRVIDDPTIEIVPPSEFHRPNQSPTDSELTRTARAVLTRHYPGVPVTVRLLGGATECVLYRSAGLQCYGFTPLVLSNEELASQHGDDERIPERALRRAAPVFYEAIADLARAR